MRWLSWCRSVEMSAPEHFTLCIYSVSRSQSPTVCQQDLEGDSEEGQEA